MSDSPRKLLRRALRALEEADAVCAEHPDAAAALESHLGAEGMAAIRAAQETLRRAVERLDASRSL